MKEKRKVVKNGDWKTFEILDMIKLNSGEERQLEKS